MSQLREWTREHDKVIAEKIEGIDVYTAYFSLGIGHSERNKSWVEYRINTKDGDPIPSYGDSIQVCFPALERWRQGAIGRYWLIESEYRTLTAFGNMACHLVSPMEGLRVDEYDPQAVAWALYRWAEGQAE